MQLLAYLDLAMIFSDENANLQKFKDYILWHGLCFCLGGFLEEAQQIYLGSGRCGPLAGVCFRAKNAAFTLKFVGSHLTKKACIQKDTEGRV